MCGDSDASQHIVVPPMSAPDVVAASPLAIEGPDGWVEVDRLTCQHKRFADVFALGDVSSLPTAKCLAAIRGQVFPWVYWHRVLMVRLHESRFLKPFAPLVRRLGLALKEP